jgi:hypothetical protein
LFFSRLCLAGFTLIKQEESLLQSKPSTQSSTKEAQRPAGGTA